MRYLLSNNHQISKGLSVLCLGAILLLCACVNQKSATKYFDKHPDKGSDYCAAKYPVHVGEAKVSEQDWSDSADTYQPASEPDMNSYGCPILHDTVTRIINHYHNTTDSIPYIDSALAHNLRLQHDKDLQTMAALQNTMIANSKAANAKYDALESKRKMWMWIALAACGGFLGIKGIWWLIKRII